MMASLDGSVGTPNVNLGGFEKVANSSNLNPSYSAGGGFADASMAFLKSGEAMQKGTEAAIKGYEDYILLPKEKKKIKDKENQITKELNDENLKEQDEASKAVRDTYRKINPTEQNSSFQDDMKYREILDDEELAILPKFAAANNMTESQAAKTMADIKISGYDKDLKSLSGDELILNNQEIAKKYAPTLSKYYGISEEEAEIKSQRIAKRLGGYKKLSEIDSALQVAKQGQQETQTTISSLLGFDANDTRSLSMGRQLLSDVNDATKSKELVAQQYGLKVIKDAYGKVDWSPESKDLINNIRIALEANANYTSGIIDSQLYKEKMNDFISNEIDPYVASKLKTEIDNATNKFNMSNMDTRRNQTEGVSGQIASLNPKDSEVTEEQINNYLKKQGFKNGIEDVLKLKNQNKTPNKTIDDNKQDTKSNNSQIDSNLNGQQVENPNNISSNNESKDISNEELVDDRKNKFQKQIRNIVTESKTSQNKNIDGYGNLYTIRQKEVDKIDNSELTELLSEANTSEEMAYIVEELGYQASYFRNSNDYQKFKHMIDEATYNANKDGIYNKGSIYEFSLDKENKKVKVGNTQVDSSYSLKYTKTDNGQLIIQSITLPHSPDNDIKTHSLSALSNKELVYLLNNNNSGGNGVQNNQYGGISANELTNIFREDNGNLLKFTLKDGKYILEKVNYDSNKEINELLGYEDNNPNRVDIKNIGSGIDKKYKIYEADTIKLIEKSKISGEVDQELIDRIAVLEILRKEKVPSSFLTDPNKMDNNRYVELTRKIADRANELSKDFLNINDSPSVRAYYNKDGTSNIEEFMNHNKNLFDKIFYDLNNPKPTGIKLNTNNNTLDFDTVQNLQYRRVLDNDLYFFKGFNDGNQSQKDISKWKKEQETKNEEYQNTLVNNLFGVGIGKTNYNKTNQELKDGSYKRKSRDIYKGKYKRDKEY